jgi:hypothetical protein
MLFRGTGNLASSSTRAEQLLQQLASTTSIHGFFEVAHEQSAELDPAACRRIDRRIDRGPARRARAAPLRAARVPAELRDRSGGQPRRATAGCTRSCASVDEGDPGRGPGAHDAGENAFETTLDRSHPLPPLSADITNPASNVASLAFGATLVSAAPVRVPSRVERSQSTWSHGTRRSTRSAARC